MADDLTEWFTQTVTQLPFTGLSSRTAPTYGAPVTVAARVQPKQVLVTKTDGAQVMSSHVVYTPTQIGIEDRIYLPGDNTSDATIRKVPLMVETGVDDTGAVVYYKTTLGRS